MESNVKTYIYLQIFLIETCFFIALIIELIKLYRNNKEQKQIIQNLNLYNNTLIKKYDGIRCLKHDFINYVQALEGYVKCKDIIGISNMMKPLYKECKSICNMDALSPQIIGDPALYNLIANKYNLACSNNIEMNVEIECKMDQINIDVYTLCRILGILLDNAIEASKETDVKVINLRVMK